MTCQWASHPWKMFAVPPGIADSSVMIICPISQALTSTAAPGSSHHRARRRPPRPSAGRDRRARRRLAIHNTPVMANPTAPTTAAVAAVATTYPPNDHGTPIRP